MHPAIESIVDIFFIGLGSLYYIYIIKQTYDNFHTNRFNETLANETLTNDLVMNESLVNESLVNQTHNSQQQEFFLYSEYGIFAGMLYLWSYMNRLKIRYYGLVITYGYTICILCEWWDPILLISVPSLFFTFFLCRNSYNFCTSYNIHLNVPARYPLKKYHIFQATLLDMYELFMIPVIHIFSLILFILCTMCSIKYEKRVLKEKDLGLFCLEQYESHSMLFTRIF